MDPVTLAVVRGGLEQIGDEMDLHLIHAAISPIISETNDCAHGIFHPDHRRDDRSGPLRPAGVPRLHAVHGAESDQGGRGRTAASSHGDIWILNDPYFGGTHLQDVSSSRRYFVDGKLFALMANTGHWMDIGGNVPGGWAPKAQEIHQEGLIIPPREALRRAGKRQRRR